jgi:hypothetical protein
VIRRIAAATVVVLAASSVGLSGCATFHNDEVASVNRHTLTNAQFDAMIHSKLWLKLSTKAPHGDVFDGDAARNLISVWIDVRAIDDAGLIDPASKQAASDAAAASLKDDWTTAPAELQQVVIMRQVVNSLTQGDPNAELTNRAAAVAAKVRVSSRFGYWNVNALSVVPFG